MPANSRWDLIQGLKGYSLHIHHINKNYHNEGPRNTLSYPYTLTHDAKSTAGTYLALAK